MRRLAAALIFAAAALSFIPGHAFMQGNNDVEYVQNPATARPDLITNISTRNIVAGSNITVVANSTGVTISASGGGGSGTSSLAVSSNGVVVSSPASNINFMPPFIVALQGSTSAQVTVNTSSVTLQGNAFNGASQLLQADSGGLLPNADLDTSSITKQGNAFNGANQLIQADSGGLVNNADLDTSSVTKQGNAFNGANQLIQADSGGLVNNADLDTSSVTKQGNSFNGASNLVQLDSSAGLPSVNGSALTLQKIGSPQYYTLQDYANFAMSPGQSSGGVITDTGSAKVNVSSGTGFIKSLDSNVATNYFIFWPSSSSIPIATNSVKFIGVSYNAGSPIVSTKATNTWDLDTEFPLGVVVNEGGNLYISTIPWISSDNTANVIERFDSLATVSRDNRTGGLVVSNTGTRNVAVTAGTLLARMSEFTISAIDTSSSGTFDHAYRNGSGGWTIQRSSTQWNNTQYDDNSGTLASIAALAYSSRWWYLMPSGKLVMLYGQATYTTLAGALNDAVPSSVPDRILYEGILIGRFIIQASGSTPSVTQSAFGTAFTAAAVTNFSDLAGTADISAQTNLTASNGITLSGDALSVDFSSIPSRASVILNQNSLQSGATFYVSSGTVSGTLIAGTFSGSGASLTNVPAASIAAGSLGSSVIASSIAVNAVNVAQMNFSGSPSATTFARGDGSWATPAGSGDMILASTQTMTAPHNISNATTDPAMKITQTGNVGTSDGTGGAFVIDTTSNTGYGMQIYTARLNGTQLTGLLVLRSATTSYDEPMLYITDESTSTVGANAEIRMDSPNPDIEFVEKDQVAPAGKYEIAVQSDRLQFNGRNAANDSFETLLDFERIGRATGGFMRLKSTATFQFGDADNSNFFGMKSADAMAADITTVLPSAIGSAGQVRRIASVSGTNVFEEWATLSASGDNFGTHKATQAVNMGAFEINNIGSSSSSWTVGGGLVVLASASLKQGLYTPGNLVTGNYTVTSTDTVVFASSTVNVVRTITLPSVVTSSGQIVEITKVDVSTAQVNIRTASSTDLIAGTTTNMYLFAPGQSLRLESDGRNNWWPKGAVPKTQPSIGISADPNGAAVVVASTTYCHAEYVADFASIIGIGLDVSAQALQSQVAVYDNFGNVISTSAKTTIGTGKVTVNLAKPAYVAPGTVWLCVGSESATTSITRRSTGGGEVGTCSFATSLPFSATVTFAGCTNSGNDYQMVGLIGGGVR